MKHALLMAGYCGAMQTPSCCSAASLFSVCSLHLAILCAEGPRSSHCTIKHDKTAQAEVCSWCVAHQASCYGRPPNTTAADDSPLCEVQVRVCCMSKHCLWYRHAAVRGSSRVRPILCTSLIASFLRGSSVSLRASTVSHTQLACGPV